MIASPSVRAGLRARLSALRPALAVVVVQFIAGCIFAWSHPGTWPAVMALLAAFANATLTLAAGRIADGWTALRRRSGTRRTFKTAMPASAEA